MGELALQVTSQGNIQAYKGEYEGSRPVEPIPLILHGGHQSISMPR